MVVYGINGLLTLTRFSDKKTTEPVFGLQKVAVVTSWC